jgi:hypothetical protein
VTPGENATISGTNFGSDTGKVTVTFNGTAAAVTSLSSTAIVATVPLSVPQGTATVEVSITGVAAKATATVTVALPDPRPSPLATWRSTTAGPRRWAAAAAFLPTPACDVLVFGGIFAGPQSDTAHLFDPVTGTWRTLAESDPQPETRRGAGLSWDFSRGQAILTGGVSDGGDLLGDTWSFDPATASWERLPFTFPRRCCHGQVYSSILQQTIVFGGFGLGAQPLADTWALSSGGWSRIETRGSPTPRWGFGIAEDAPSGRIVLYGGFNGQDVFDDTWIFDPRTLNWSFIPSSPSLAPGPRWVHSMAYSSQLQGVVLHGGRSGTSLARNDPTWIFDMRALRWVPVSTATSPPPRSDAQLVADLCRPSLILFGATGSAGPPVPTPEENLTWILE